MKDSSAYLTPGDAAHLMGYTTRHIQNLIRKGKITAVRDDGRYYIEKSEFFRVFPDAFNNSPEAKNTSKAMDTAKMEVENQYLKEIAADKDKQIEYLKKQLEDTLAKEGKLIEAVNSNARLLEYKASQLEEDAIFKRKGWFERFKNK